MEREAKETVEKNPAQPAPLPPQVARPGGHAEEQFDPLNFDNTFVVEQFLKSLRGGNLPDCLDKLEKKHLHLISAETVEAKTAAYEAWRSDALTKTDDLRAIMEALLPLMDMLYPMVTFAKDYREKVKSGEKAKLDMTGKGISMALDVLGIGDKKDRDVIAAIVQILRKHIEKNKTSILATLQGVDIEPVKLVLLKYEVITDDLIETFTKAEPKQLPQG